MSTDRHKLFVNLSASQARKRLKGHGFGVRKVFSEDRNQAVIIHTATGQHLRELESLFADVISSSTRNALDEPIENLRNLGPTSAQWLRDANIHSLSDLQQMGPVVAYLLVKQNRPEASLNLLWALAGAVADCDWRELDEQEKLRLREAVDRDDRI